MRFAPCLRTRHDPCHMPDAARTRAHDEPGAQAATTAVDPPKRILLERRTEDGEDLHADRVGVDGSVWRETTVRARFDASGALKISRGPASWERLGIRAARSRRSLGAAIPGSGAADPPGEVHAEFAAVSGFDVLWTLAGRRVLVRGAPAATTPGLERLGAALDRAIA